MQWKRVLFSWLFIAIAESIHGILRRIFLLPVLGELRAHQFGVLVGCLIIFAIAGATIRWIGARTLSSQLEVGGVWLILMLAFEVGLGYAFGYSRDQILLDYNLAEGRLMILGMVFMLFAPALAARARGYAPANL